MKPHLKFLIPPLTCISLVSCGAMDRMKETTTHAGQKFSETGKKISQFSLNDLRPAKIEVVEVREKDLKDMPTGHEKALAFENKRKRDFWFFGGPIHFKEPTLPEPGSEMDGSLLPPRME